MTVIPLKAHKINPVILDYPNSLVVLRNGSWSKIGFKAKTSNKAIPSK